MNLRYKITYVHKSNVLHLKTKIYIYYIFDIRFLPYSNVRGVVFWPWRRRVTSINPCIRMDRVGIKIDRL